MSQQPYSMPLGAEFSLAAMAFRRLCWPLIESALLYLFFSTSADLGIRHSSGGELFDLTPHGLGRLYDALIIVVYVTLLHVLSTRASRKVRKWIGVTLQFLMFLMFVGVLSGVQYEEFVAVRLIDDHVSLIRHYPRAAVEITPSSGLQAEVKDTGSRRTLIIDLPRHGFWTSMTVYRADPTASANLSHLVSRLNAEHQINRADLQF